jgi:2-phospho-L-lactate guanylyltransferase
VNWTAIVPIKEPLARKTRLRPMDSANRVALTETFLDHVLAAVDGHPDVGKAFILSPVAREGRNWIEDKRRGLNAELNATRLGRGAVLVVHADLPLLDGEDISAMLDCAQRFGGALAPDRHGVGTNAIALVAGFPFNFAFGPESRRLHQVQLSPKAVVMRRGLALDIDTPEDLSWLPQDP